MASKSKTLKGTTTQQHGRLGNPAWAPPILVAEALEEARPGYAKINASEYDEHPDTFALKISLLAELIRKSSNMLAYTGAGLSTASGIADYATKAEKSSVFPASAPTGPAPPGGVTSPMDAKPTYGHRVLVELFRKGYLKHWVQQNHDGLPQKAGFPQSNLNEIHGSWFDPSNPVIPMSGMLRTDLFNWLLEWEKKSDLVLAMGTSLAGMNADRVATSVADRAAEGKESKEGEKPIGLVIISIQQTSIDGKASLRIFAKIDKVMEALAAELKLTVPAPMPYELKVPAEALVDGSDEVFKIPYDKDGKFVPDAVEDYSRRTNLDLREDAVVKMCIGPFEGDLGRITGRNREKQWKIRFWHVHPSNPKKRVPMERTLGLWLVADACMGRIISPAAVFPVVNFPPEEAAKLPGYENL